jgi:hypothetical protein
LSLTSGPPLDDAARDEQSSSDSPARRAATTRLAEFQPLSLATKSNLPLRECAIEDELLLSLQTNKPFSLFNPPLEALASITEADFQRVFARSPIRRAKYRGWLRNLCVVIGNSGDRRFIPWLETAADNPDTMVQEHAAWALRRLQGGA